MIFLNISPKISRKTNIVMDLLTRCSYSFKCLDHNKTIHFKFDRFETETGFDYFIIGDPDAFNCIKKMHYMDFQEGLNLECINRQALIIHGHQSYTDAWVEAKNTTDFHISFFRRVFL